VKTNGKLKMVPLGLVLVAATISPPFRAAGGPEKEPAETRGVACLGRISPRDGIIHLAQPASSYPGLSPVAELKAREGEMVKKGQALAVLENEARLETSWRAALAQAKVAETRLAQVQAGANPADIAVLQADADRLAAETEGARINHERSVKLKADSAITDVAFQTTQLELETRLKMLEGAKQKLRSVAEVREVDLAVARAQFEAAKTEAEHAKAELEQAFIRAPADGRVIKIWAHPGEQIGAQGALELATVNPIYALAEIYESDAGRVKPGQKATITGEAFAGKLTGVVEEIGSKVGRNNLPSMDPAVANDARIVEAWIRLDQNEPADRYLEARVSVVIQP
jgi:HlyD family secretion protein